MFSDISRPLHQFQQNQMGLISALYWQQQQEMMKLENTNALQGQGIQLKSVESTLPTGPGTLYIDDSFVASKPDEFSSPANNPHGINVARAARQQGFRGAIVGTDRSTPGPITSTDKVWLNSLDGLNTHGRRPEQTIADIRSYASNSGASLLDEETAKLRELTRSGASNSVVNFSLGASKARCVQKLYSDATLCLQKNLPFNHPGVPDSYAMLSNIATAGNLSMEKLVSSDPKIRNAERGRLSQFLIDQVSTGYDNDHTLKASQKRYDRAVQSFEARSNSVVVSAGNHGSILEQLSKMNGGYALKAPDDFSRNLLENNAVTSVGATETTPWKSSGVQRAGYSSKSAGVDVYAAGGLGLYDNSGQEVQGTSFAAPRVAAMMAELHRRNPGASSAQIERLLQQLLTQSAQDGESTLRVLDDQSTSEFLAGQRF